MYIECLGNVQGVYRMYIVCLENVCRVYIECIYRGCT